MVKVISLVRGAFHQWDCAHQQETQNYYEWRLHKRSITNPTIEVK